jgi:probable HAF family extracellular repeat protein
VILLSIGLAAPEARAQGPGRYRLDILETFPDVSPFTGKVYEQASASARAINSAGQITGPANSDKAIVSLGDGGLFAAGQAPRRVGDIPDAAQISPQAINDLGQVVGWSSTNPGTGSFPVYAFFDDGSGPGALQLNPLAGGTNSQAFGLNEEGTIVGTSDINSDGSQYRPVAWSVTGQITQLPSVGNGQANAVNSSGIAVGFDARDSGDSGGTVAVYWDESGDRHVIDMGDAPLTSASAVAVTDTGLILLGGSSTTGLAVHDLGTGRTTWAAHPETSVTYRDLSSDGWAVGTENPFSSGTDVGTLTSPDGQVYDLNDLLAGDLADGVRIAQGWGINEAGQIAVTVRNYYDPELDLTFSVKPALLTPVPEPGLSALLLTGLIPMLRRRRASRGPCDGPATDSSH